ncbi:hypothetical protein GCM10023167_24950 [Brevibacterium pityocampae]|uniref:Uncharacterized protein n=1 Tax=Brevibacterium pityocampae TaxID=506594 RepID=A0ABP8JRG7_9MICO
MHRRAKSRNVAPIADPPAGLSAISLRNRGRDGTVRFIAENSTRNRPDRIPGSTENGATTGGETSACHSIRNHHQGFSPL